MVVSERIIWLHVPKTAGDTTLRMFQLVDHPWRIMDPHTDPQKHGTLADAHRRAPGSESCEVMINLRRLPEVLVSYYHHMQRHSPGERYANGKPWGETSYREYLEYVLSHPEDQSYDWILNHYLGDRDADHYLKVSDLAASFVAAVGGHHDIPPGVREAIHSIRANVGPYQRGELADWFAGDELRALYRNCPRWARCETAVYGNILAPDVQVGSGARAAG